ncbi:MAG: saccharopine dehydrogenase NADP-binding domain-containing protein [Bacteroidetes bacterium]|nr:saccharopine dehydrogenase NADP-binding domain-containing protein [Bacteroidota bacterium]
MKKILIVGAGKSSPWLIRYMLKATRTKRTDWQLTIADADEAALLSKVEGYPDTRIVALDIKNDVQRKSLVQDADLVLSLMPPALHILLAKDCLEFKKHLITSSYVSPEMKALDEEAKKAGVMFMCEMGLDPGIDHMSAHKIIHSIQRIIGDITSFSSFCGGLVAPESDNNPWHYKISWNPNNVVDAGKSGASYIVDSVKKELGYKDLFKKNGSIEVAKLGKFAWYPNRDSLQYMETYDIPHAKTFVRATLRHPDFCLGWLALVNLGLTDRNVKPEESVKTYAEWMAAISNYTPSEITLKDHVVDLANVKPRDKAMKMLEWLGLFSEQPLPSTRNSNAEVLLSLLQDKWAMGEKDKDMVVMQHEIEYTHRGSQHRLISSMSAIGENAEYTAMAKTVGLPIAILAKLLYTGAVKPIPGVVIPDMPSVYRPVLNELKHYDIVFEEHTV